MFLKLEEWLKLNIEQLELIKKEIDQLLDGIYDTQERLVIAKTKLEEGVVINGKALDDGKIKKDLQQLEYIIQNLVNIRKHCNEKITISEKK